MCVLRLVKGTQEEAYSVAYKQQQKAAPSAPPTPHHPQRTFRDATTVTKAPAEPAKKAEEHHEKEPHRRKHAPEASAGEEGVARRSRARRRRHLHHPPPSRAPARADGLAPSAREARPRRLGLAALRETPDRPVRVERPQDRCSSAWQISPISPGPS